ncbi:MAG: TetR/AcrR family transcriptional regulator [Parvibaculum sp.]|nr:TetR/AcrR family transcriptional regulator [Parvibaculum sp.]
MARTALMPAKRKPKADTSARDVKGEISAYKRRLILEEACHLFYAHGYEGTTLDAIAERLNVTKPFIYSYHRNKAEILREISERGIRLCLAALDEVRSNGGTPLAQLKAIVDRVTTLILENQEYIVVYQREEKNLEPATARDIRRLRKMFDTRLEALLDEGVASGEFDIEDTGFAAISISGLMSWTANWFQPGGRRPASEVIVQTLKMVTHMVAAPK